MKEPYIINISFLKKNTFWAINHTLIKGARQKRDKKKKRNDHILPAWKDLVIHSNIKVEEIWLKDSRRLLCDYCKLNGALYNVYFLIMDDIIPTFSTFLLSKLSSCFYVYTSLRMPALSPMYFETISDYIFCKKTWHKHKYLPTLILPSLFYKYALMTTCDKLLTKWSGLRAIPCLTFLYMSHALRNTISHIHIH